MSKEFVEGFTEKDWRSPEFRQYIIGTMGDYDELCDEHRKLKVSHEAQCAYVEMLEKQLGILQKTLDVAQKIINAPKFFSGDEVKLI